MAISNKAKRKITCQFCTKKRGNCRCQKYWKEVYKEHREEILDIYHRTKDTPSQP